jgi:hypothetical protein
VRVRSDYGGSIPQKNRQRPGRDLFQGATGGVLSDSSNIWSSQRWAVRAAGMLCGSEGRCDRAPDLSALGFFGELGSLMGPAREQRRKSSPNNGGLVLARQRVARQQAAHQNGRTADGRRRARDLVFFYPVSGQQASWREDATLPRCRSKPRCQLRPPRTSMLSTLLFLGLSGTALAWNDIAGALTYKGTSHVFQGCPGGGQPGSSAHGWHHAASTDLVHCAWRTVSSALRYVNWAPHVPYTMC